MLLRVISSVLPPSPRHMELGAIRPRGEGQRLLDDPRVKRLCLGESAAV